MCFNLIKSTTYILECLYLSTNTSIDDISKILKMKHLQQIPHVGGGSLRCKVLFQQILNLMGYLMLKMTLLHILHFGTYLASTTIYIVLMLTNLAFVNAMEKVERSSGLNSSLVIFVGCPLASLLSILARLLYIKTEPWSIIQRSGKRSCCPCCPPKLKGSFKAIRIEDIPNEETPAAEYRDVLDHLAERNNRM